MNYIHKELHLNLVQFIEKAGSRNDVLDESGVREQRGYRFCFLAFFTAWLEAIQIQRIVVASTLKAKAASCLTGVLHSKYITNIAIYQIFQFP